MNIGFEAKRFFTNFTGLGNYSRFIVDALSTHAKDDNYFLYTPRLSDHPEIASILDHKNVHVVKPEGIFSKPFLSALWRSWLMSSHDTVKDLNVFHGLSQELPLGLPAHIKKVVTVHDLIFLRYPQFYNPIDVKIYTSKVDKACKTADCIIAISEQTAEDIQSFFHVDPKKIKVVYQGCHPNFKVKVGLHDRSAVLRKYNIPDHYILNVGTIEERKNILVVIKAMTLIPQNKRVHLVVIGKQTKYITRLTEEVEKNNLHSHVTFLHHVSFKDFPAIYQSASLFIYPSFFEGFGIPLVEAIESGIPVITSEGSCFKEAAGPNAIYINPNNAEELAARIVEVTENPNGYTQMVEKNSSYIRRFQPQVIGKELNHIYNSLL